MRLTTFAGLEAGFSFGAGRPSYTWLGADDSIPSIVVPRTTISTRTNDLLLITGKLGYA